MSYDHVTEVVVFCFETVTKILMQMRANSCMCACVHAHTCCVFVSHAQLPSAPRQSLPDSCEGQQSYSAS